MNRVGNDCTMTLNNFTDTNKNGTAQPLVIPGVIPLEFRPAKNLTVFTTIRYKGSYTPVIFILADGSITFTRDYAGRDMEANEAIGWDRMIFHWSVNTAGLP